MIKAKILGMGNDGIFNYIIVNKNKSLFKWMSKLFRDSLEIEFYEYDEYKNKKGEWTTRKRRMEEFTDKHESYGNKKAEIDIFYGKNKIFIMLRTSLEARKKLMKVLDKISSWKIPKIKNKIKKVIKKI